MEYLEGQDLRGVCERKGKLPPEEAAKIILQICRALEAAHGEGVIHRDLKPQNIMFGRERARVCDGLGIARSAYLPGMTQTGALVGTPEYMSPEQAKGEKLDERSDLFSLGTILYELIIGQSPYYSDTPLATLWKRIQEKAKPLNEVDPTIPKPLSDIVARPWKLSRKIALRPAHEFAQHLETWWGISPSLVGPSPINCWCRCRGKNRVGNTQRSLPRYCCWLLLVSACQKKFFPVLQKRPRTNPLACLSRTSPTIPVILFR